MNDTTQPPRPGHWQIVRTDAGWHLRLVGANGEPVLTSEVYTDPDTAREAWAVTRRSFQDTRVVTVDERTQQL